MDRWLEYLRTTLFLSILTALLVQSLVNDYERSLSSLLSNTVTEDGLVDYDSIRDKSDSLNTVLQGIGDFQGPLVNDNQKKAFWINAYNAYMISFIAEEPDVHDIVADGFADQFFKTKVSVAGLELSLDEIEHKILRQADSNLPEGLVVAKLDPRIHVGLNCGAISCPSLAREAYSEATVDALLDSRMRIFVNSEKYVRWEGNSLVLSSLLDWFGDDWDSTGIPAGDYLLEYMEESRPDFLKIQDLLHGKSASQIGLIPNVRFEYDWTVNSLSFHR